MNKKLQASGRRRTKDHTMLDARPVESFPPASARGHFFFGTVSGRVVVFRLSGQGPITVHCTTGPASGHWTLQQFHPGFAAHC